MTSNQIPELLEQAKCLRLDVLSASLSQENSSLTQLVELIDSACTVLENSRNPNAAAVRLLRFGLGKVQRVAINCQNNTTIEAAVLGLAASAAHDIQLAVTTLATAEVHSRGLLPPSSDGSRAGRSSSSSSSSSSSGASGSGSSSGSNARARPSAPRSRGSAPGGCTTTVTTTGSGGVRRAASSTAPEKQMLAASLGGQSSRSLSSSCNSSRGSSRRSTADALLGAASSPGLKQPWSGGAAASSNTSSAGGSRRASGPHRQLQGGGLEASAARLLRHAGANHAAALQPASPQQLRSWAGSSELQELPSEPAEDGSSPAQLADGCCGHQDNDEGAANLKALLLPGTSWRLDHGSGGFVCRPDSEAGDDDASSGSLGEGSEGGGGGNNPEEEAGDDGAFGHALEEEEEEEEEEEAAAQQHSADEGCGRPEDALAVAAEMEQHQQQQPEQAEEEVDGRHQLQRGSSSETDATEPPTVIAARQLLQQGNTHYRTGAFAAAALRYQAAMNELPSAAAAAPVADSTPPERRQRALWLTCALNLACCHLRLGHGRPCVAACDALLEVDPDNAVALCHRGRAWLLLDQAQAARADLCAARDVLAGSGQASKSSPIHHDAQFWLKRVKGLLSELL